MKGNTNETTSTACRMTAGRSGKTHLNNAIPKLNTLNDDKLVFVVPDKISQISNMDSSPTEMVRYFLRNVVSL
jgi:hypothetical protein